MVASGGVNDVMVVPDTYSIPWPCSGSLWVEGGGRQGRLAVLKDAERSSTLTSKTGKRGACSRTAQAGTGDGGSAQGWWPTDM